MKIKAMAVIKITISCLIFFNSINTCFAADFPSTYEKSSEKVKFDCELEIPKDFSETEMYSEKTKGRIYPDMDKTISIYTQGKEVKEMGQYRQRLQKILKEFIMSLQMALHYPLTALLHMVQIPQSIMDILEYVILNIKNGLNNRQFLLWIRIQ